MTETGSHLANIGVVHYEDGKWQEDLHAYGQFNKEDAKVKAIVDKAQAAIDKKLATKVGTTPFELNDPATRACARRRRTSATSSPMLTSGRSARPQCSTASRLTAPW